MNNRTRELVHSFTALKNYPDAAAAVAGQVIDGMIARSPAQTEHIYSAAEGLTYQKGRVGEAGDVKMGTEDARILSEIKPIWTADGKVDMVEKNQTILVDFDFDPNNPLHRYMLTHEMGHAVHHKFMFNSRNLMATIKTNCMTKKYRFNIFDDKPALQQMESIGENLGETLNDINTYYLQRQIGHRPDIMDASPYLLGRLMLFALNQKYNLKNDYLEADEQTNYDVLSNAINKKTKINTALFPNKEPIDVLGDYCDSIVNIGDDSAKIGEQTEKVAEYYNLNI